MSGLWILSLSISSVALSIPTQAHVLKWQDCVQLAIEKNPDLKANQAALKSTQAQEGVASAGFYPTLNGILSYNRFTPSTYDPNQDQGNSGDSFNTTFKLNQNLLKFQVFYSIF